jgi:GTP-binding protein LepA
MHPDVAHIRNFCIVAHIDHGKSTLADRLLEFTGTVSKREMKDQLLDDMVLERERGITIKARAVKMPYRRGSEEFEFNLIDTPGHVDFHYEVSRSLACCEGAILVVDAAQGVEAQTLANAFAAMNSGLTIVPIINKIDLVNARVEEVLLEIEHSLAIDASEVLKVSAKTGVGIQELVDAVIDRMPPPKGDPGGVLQAMVFDSHYDDYRGAVTYVRVMNGRVTKGSKVRFISTGTTHEVGGVSIERRARREQRALGLQNVDVECLDLAGRAAEAREHAKWAQAVERVSGFSPRRSITRMLSPS